MDYYKLIAVTGLPGLYELINSKKDGAIIRSLQDNTTRFASTRIHQFSHLESIEIYTVGDNANLADIFKAMDENEATLPDAKDDKAVLDYFKKVYADMDFDRVYKSDMKKIIKWFDILKKNNIEVKLSEPEVEKEITSDADIIQPENEVVEKTGKKSDKKKEKVEKEKDDVKAAKEATPEKKAAPKKAAPKKTTKTATKKKAE